MLTSLSAAIAPSLIRQMITLDPCRPNGVVFVILASVVSRAKEIKDESLIALVFFYAISINLVPSFMTVPKHSLPTLEIAWAFLCLTFSEV